MPMKSSLEIAKRAAHQTYDLFNAGKHMTIIYTENIY